MKHIKQFENYKIIKPKFEVDEIIKIVDKGDDLYKIDKRNFVKKDGLKHIIINAVGQPIRCEYPVKKEIYKNQDGYIYYTYNIRTDDWLSYWIQEKDMIKIPKYEIDAIKYNL